MLKIDKPELAHYIIGGLALIGVTPTLMEVFPASFDLMSLVFWQFATAWIVAYIIIDQILHVVVMGKKWDIVTL